MKHERGRRIAGNANFPRVRQTTNWPVFIIWYMTMCGRVLLLLLLPRLMWLVIWVNVRAHVFVANARDRAHTHTTTTIGHRFICDPPEVQLKNNFGIGCGIRSSNESSFWHRADSRCAVCRCNKFALWRQTEPMMMIVVVMVMEESAASNEKKKQSRVSEFFFLLLRCPMPTRFSDRSWTANSHWTGEETTRTKRARKKTAHCQ